MLGNEAGDETGWVPFTAVNTAPCKNLDKEVEEDGVTPKVNLTYRFNEDVLMYVTYSEGFRPGGVNRRGTFPPYDADYLKNYEIGWKTTLAEGRVRWNGALFYLDWDDFQFSFLGDNGLTNVTNAGGARIQGVETDIDWAVTDRLLVSAGVTLLDAQLTEDFCENLDADGNPLTLDECFEDDPYTGNPVLRGVPDGTDLPLVPKYKANLTGRYGWQLGSLDAHVQAAFMYQDDNRSALVVADEVVLGGPNGAYGLADFSFGVGSESWNVELFVTNAFDERADLTRFAQCDEGICPHPYIVTNQPRTVGLKFGQRF